MVQRRKKTKFIPVLGLSYPVISMSMLPITPYPRIEKILEESCSKNTDFILVYHPDESLKDCSVEELQESYACLASVSSRENFSDGSHAYIVCVKGRVTVDDVNRITDFVEESNFELLATYKPLFLVPYDNETVSEAMVRQDMLMEYKKFAMSHNGHINSEMIKVIEEGAPSFTLFCDSIASTVLFDEKQRAEYISLKSENELAEFLMTVMAMDAKNQQMMEQIRDRAKESIEINQKIYFLSEHLKSAQQELKNLKNSRAQIDGGQDASFADDGLQENVDEVAVLRTKIKEAGMPDDVAEKCNAELRKLAMQPGFSQDAAISRNYIETILALPWNKSSELKKDLKGAEEILDHDHYGLDKVKERILEYLAVQNRADRLHAPIICLVGPPGVGKTSLGVSIAKATGRTYVRVALGGMRDEAEIRGHRRTYVGALPGKIIQKLMKCGVKNPLFLLDEIDKISTDSYRGDPASALLEVLDPEQNKSFTDNYLEVDFDLSDVMFVATSNSLNIPPALRDRMEIINLSSYTEEEKLHIARNHLIPKQMTDNNVKDDEINFTDEAILSLIRNYTSEAGVRNLEREIGRLCRKTVKEIMLSSGKVTHIDITGETLKKMLGPWVFDHTDITLDNKVGIVNGLAYTSVGGEILTIEASSIPGFGKQVYTGKLGEVMRESISAAFTVVRSYIAGLGYTPKYFRQNDFHIHCPEGAIPKDGPSAGIAMCTAIISAITGTPVRGDVAMTGEITLRGEVLPIGGVKEKLIGAVRGGVKKVLIPHGNVKDLEEVPESTLKALTVVPVKHITEVFKEALCGPIKKFKPKADDDSEELPPNPDDENEFGEVFEEEKEKAVTKKKTVKKTTSKSSGSSKAKKDDSAAKTTAKKSSGVKKTSTATKPAKKTTKPQDKLDAGAEDRISSAKDEFVRGGDDLTRSSEEFTDGLDNDSVEIS
ncbi:endopeptidase La [Ruminobacter sp.]|uniref:endopeptidase La n=1 Tax=Ruminobacter sp. TaxID=2774296 RepID=UPI003867E324